MASQDEVARAYLERMARELLSWSGDVEKARDLRRELQQPPPLGKNGHAPLEIAVREIVKAYQKQRGAKLLQTKAIKKNWQATFRRMLSPVLGDPAMGPWPFHDPYRIADDEVAGALELAELCGVVEAEARAFVRVLYLTRRRPTWVPAADALARLSLRDRASRDFLVSEWETFFPDGIPEQWPAAGFNAFRPAGMEKGKVVHRVRHLLRAVGSWLAGGGGPAVFSGLSVEALVRPRLPRESSDASAVWLALQPLLMQLPPQSEVMGEALARVHETAADVQAEKILREIARALPSSDALAITIADHLVKPRWGDLTGDRLVGAVVSWVDTARWAAARGRTDLLSQMRASAAEGACALSLRLDGALPGEDPLDSLLARLRCLLDGNAYLTTPRGRRALVVAETLQLLAHPEIRALPWPQLAARALGQVETQRPEPGAKAERVGKAALLMTLSRWESKDVPSFLLRDIRLPRRDVLALAECGNPRIDIQVAVQLERLLREASSAPERVRLLWDLLWVARTEKLFSELADISREDPLSGVEERAKTLGGRIAVVARAAGGLVEARLEEPSPASRARMAECVAAVLAALRALLEEEPDTEGAWVAERLREVEEGLEELVASFSDPATWLRRQEAVLLGDRAKSPEDDTRPGGLLGLLAWHGVDTGPLEERWVALSQAVRTGMSAERLVPEQGAEIGEAVADLRAALSVLPWPARRLLGVQLNGLLRWRDQRLEEAVRHLQAVRELEDALDQRDQKRASELGPVLAAMLSGETVRRLHLFLLNEGRVEEAKAVRAALTGQRPSLVRDLVGEALEEAISRSATEEVVRLVSSLELFPRGAPLRKAHAYLLRLGECWKAAELRRRARDMARDVSILVDDAFEMALDAGDKARMVALIQEGEALPSREMARRVHDFLLDHDGDEEARGLREGLRKGSLDVGDLEESALRNAIDDRHVARVIRLLKDQQAILPEPSIRKAHDFLLRTLHFEEADRLRGVAEPRGIHLPRYLSRLGTLVSGVVAGTVLVLDVGKDWNDLVLSNFWFQAGAVTLVCFCAAFGLLVGEVAQQSARAPRESRRDYWGGILLRVIPIFFSLSVLAFVTSEFALLSLMDTSVFCDHHLFVQSLLWAALSLFLGLFMGLLLQGRRFLSGK